MSNERRDAITRLTGGLFGMVIAAGLLAVFEAAGGRFVVVAELLGFAWVQGPWWLGPAVGVGGVVAAAFAGAWLAPAATETPVLAALEGVLLVSCSFVLWTLVWNFLRLMREGGVGAAPFLPIHAALLAFAGLLLPAIVLFLPAGLCWATAVRSLRRLVGRNVASR